MKEEGQIEEIDKGMNGRGSKLFLKLDNPLVSVLLEYRTIFTKYGMQQDIEAVIDSLWNMDKDIQQYIYKEPKALHFRFKYGVDGWRDLLDLVEKPC
ncbi:MAG TPA: hypothetical protein VFS97_02605 [Nitrososphaeraceae archaeon]|nr:hypothetical protein [Nitrososphaeraceae archaeon]